MLRNILNKAMGSRRRTTGLSGPTARPTTSGRPTTGSGNRDIEQGARSLLRGLGRRRRGL